MVRKYLFGNPFNTEAVVGNLDTQEGSLPYFNVDNSDKCIFSYKLQEDDRIYGLGENVRGINRRGNIFESYCTDDPNHTEDTKSLYGAHNFFIVDGHDRFGVFFDYPGRVVFDMGYTSVSELTVTADTGNIAVYIVTGDSLKEIVKEFRQIIGMSYVAPKWAFGYQQSRWGYQNRQDLDYVADNYQKAGIPLDAIYMDIDYMDSFKDFTVDSEKFPDFEQYVQEMRQRGIRLVPIIDAGVKIEAGYDIYEEGVEGNYFCKDIDGNDYVTAVWPGYTHFPDFLNPETRKWFGDKYKILTDMGIEGFWNDMNEPAIFHSERGLNEIWDKIEKLDMVNRNPDELMELKWKFAELANNPEDYDSFYHNVDGKMIKHNSVHNMYGYNMTRAAGEAFERYLPDKRILMFSRASYIGMHRYGGIWMGDNMSWWSHILMNLQMLPSLNMCGFMYTGADIGGFGCNASRELLLRWLELGVFTPLMRNHSAAGTRMQECFRFENTDDFRRIIEFRYSLIPYLYSEYMKATLNDEMMFCPLAFEYENDEIAANVEDQLMVGDDIMIAPVYVQNAKGRYVYLPERMMCVTFPDRKARVLEKGHHYVPVMPNEVLIFIRENHMIPLCEPAMNTDSLNEKNLMMLGFVSGQSEYVLYTDDGYSREYENPDNYVTIHSEMDADGVEILWCDNEEYDIERFEINE